CRNSASVKPSTSLLVARLIAGLPIGAQRPIREPFIPVALLDEVAHHTLDVVAELVAGDLVLPQFSPEATVEPQAATEMHLESLDGSAVAVVDHLAFETDVGDLDAGTRVRAAVDVDGDRHVQLRVEVIEPALEFGHQRLRTHSSFGE